MKYGKNSCIKIKNLGFVKNFTDLLRWVMVEDMITLNLPLIEKMLIYVVIIFNNTMLRLLSFDPSSWRNIVPLANHCRLISVLFSSNSNTHAFITSALSELVNVFHSTLQHFTTKKLQYKIHLTL